MDGYIGDLRVAEVWHAEGREDRVWAIVYVAPLPGRLDDMTDTAKANVRQAKATAQRIVNAYVKLITGEKTS
jgi:hypothetical protein